MKNMKKGRKGFTLIELMIVVAILGILAAIAIPTFILLINRSKSAEAASNIKNMFTAVAAYYSGELTSKAINASTGGYCTVGSSNPTPAVPSASKQPFAPQDSNFAAIGFHIADHVFYSYMLVSEQSTCGNVVNNPEVYTISANGDLDEDTTFSTFELAVASDHSNTLYHGRGFYVVNEME
jgi:type IV pilus assembly protein PilA